MTFWTDPPTCSRGSRSWRVPHYFRRDLQRGLGRLRQIIEGDEPVERVGVGGGEPLPAGVR